MKPKPSPPRKPSAPAPAQAGLGSPAGRERRWFFRLLATTLAPVVLLAGLEAALRLIGFGYDTAYFRTIQAAGKRMVVENDQFSWRFFPPHLARRPLPIAFSPEKERGVYRIFVLGESAAMGDPEPAFSFGRVLGALLQERYPQGHFEVINLAFTAINSHVILPIARECARRQGDLWVVYMGHNEVPGPYGPGTVFGGRSSRLWLTRTVLALKTTRIGQLADRLRARLNKSGAPPGTWQGLEMFLRNQFRQGDPRLEFMYDQFAANVRDIVRTARRAGAEVILCRPASNLKDNAPFASLPSPGLRPEQTAAWKQQFQSALALETAGKSQEALPLLQALATQDAHEASGAFLLGRTLLALDRRPEALRQFESARDLDTLRFRADTRLGQIVQAIAKSWEGRGVTFCDAPQDLARGVADGIPGEELFFDHVHFKFDGNYLLARALAEQVAPRLPAALKQQDSGDWATAERCANRLGLTPWHEYQMFEVLYRRLLEAPFTNQLFHSARQERYLQQLAALRSALLPEGLQTAAQTCRDALAHSPDDPNLHELYGRVLAALGDRPGAISEFQRVADAWPRQAAAYNNIGLLLHQLGRDREAEDYLRQALARRRDFAEAHVGLGMIRLASGKPDEAVAFYRQALADNPDLADARLNLGLALERLGKPAEAKEQYLALLQARPTYAPAHLALADLLLQHGQTFDAIPHLNDAAKSQPETTLARARKAVQSRPNDPLAHFKLANALASVNLASNAVESLEAAVRLNTNYWEARYLLGVELAGQDRLPEAERQFAAVIQLRPEYARAHLNRGVAQAKQLHLAEAAAAFAEALRLEPANAAARQYLQQIQTLTNSARNSRP